MGDGGQRLEVLAGQFGAGNGEELLLDLLLGGWAGGLGKCRAGGEGKQDDGRGEFAQSQSGSKGLRTVRRVKSQITRKALVFRGEPRT